ncbi:MAG: hypothetical protein WD928_05225 [Gammaproteobacteria bacterium]
MTGPDDIDRAVDKTLGANNNRPQPRTVKVEHSGEVTVNLVVHDSSPRPPGSSTPAARTRRPRSSTAGRLVLNPAPWVRAMVDREGES